MNTESTKKNTLMLEALPDAKHKDYFKILVNNCIAAYGRVFSDKAALDLNKVTGKMRALVLDDRRYIEETRSLKAQQMLNEIEEIEYLASLAAGEKPDEGAYDYDPRAKGGKKKTTTADKDMLTMRFKAAQMKREIWALSAAGGEADEKDAVNVFYVPSSRDEVLQLLDTELDAGSDAADFQGLLSEKEELPESSTGKTRIKAKTKVSSEPIYRERPDGTVEEL
jgi:hypothetical protein